MLRTSRSGLYGAVSAATLAALLCAAPAAAQQQVREFDIPAGELGAALNTFARQANQEIMFTSALVAGKRTSGVSGRHETTTALNLLLRGTGLEVASAGGSIITLRRAASPPGRSGASRRR